MSGPHISGNAATSGQPAEIDHLYPYVTRVIRRGVWSFDEYARFNEETIRIDRDHREGSFNGIYRAHFRQPDQAAALAAFVASKGLDRLVADCTDKPTPEQVADEWIRLGQEREAILAWGRSTQMLRHVVQEYRFERHMGSRSHTAHAAAARLVAKADRSIADPLNYAGVLIEWAEREHRCWFWRGCRGDHVL
jgi:hypothetical protein